MGNLQGDSGDPARRCSLRAGRRRDPHHNAVSCRPACWASRPRSHRMAMPTYERDAHEHAQVRPEDHGATSQAQRLPLRAAVDAAAGVREHREHRAPVRPAPARRGARLGRTNRSSSSTATSGSRAPRSRTGTASSGSWPRSAWGAPASCWAWRCRAWRATPPTGTGCWRSARSPTRSSSTRTASTTRRTSTTGCCSASRAR